VRHIHTAGRLVKPAVEKYLKPFLLARPRIGSRISAILLRQLVLENGPVLNNAISGIDMALWDIKGRQAGMPVYQLVGGKCREAADTYASGWPRLQKMWSQRRNAIWRRGFVCARPCRRSRDGRLRRRRRRAAVKALHNQPVFEPAVYLRRALKLLEVCRQGTGESRVAHDMHERVCPIRPFSSGKDAEKFKLFFVEDPLSNR